MTHSQSSPSQVELRTMADALRYAAEWRRIAELALWERDNAEAILEAQAIAAVAQAEAKLG